MEHKELLRFREKSHFVEANDPASLLAEFFIAASQRPAVRKTLASEAPRQLPLLLISQLPRSGGSLFSQLLDGHPQLLVYPHEMRIGYPGKDTWPKLDPHDLPDRLFAKLFQPELVHFVRNGYRKPGKFKQPQAALPFDYSPRDHYRLFISLMKHPKTPRAWRFSIQNLLNGRWAYSRDGRHVLDCYFSAFFAAWPTGQTVNPRYVAGFIPSMAQSPASIARFFADYADGRLVTIMRNPVDWFVSRRAHTYKSAVRFNNLDAEIAIWNRMARLALRYQRKYGAKMMLLSFKELVANREPTMRLFANWCGIDFDAALLNQTFARRPILPNTNFNDSLEQLPSAVLERSSQLTKTEVARTLELTQTWRARLESIGCSL
jgi:hypothetical protein